MAVSATLNQDGRPVAFMSRSFSGSELAYLAVEKEATAIIEAVKRWRHLLMRQHFTLVTDQRSVAFMLDSRKKTKVKNNKILCWRLELASFAYTILYRPGKENVAADALTRASCSTVLGQSSILDELHKELCCPGITRLWHYVRVKNLPYSLDDVKKTCSRCEVCAEIRPTFYKPPHNALIKATQPMERLNIDFKGPLPSTSRNEYFLCIVDEYSRYPFCFPCANTSTTTVIECLKKIFALFGTCRFIHSDRGTSFSSKQFKDFLMMKGIASSRTTPYHPQGNSQCERYNGIVWRAVKCALRARQLPIQKWESVLSTALDSIRSLLCTSTGETPHSRFFCFDRRSSHGFSLPDWLSEPGPVMLRKFVRNGKNDDIVQKVELIEANPTYARIRYPDGREANVSLRDLARYPRERARQDGYEQSDEGRDGCDDGRELVYGEQRRNERTAELTEDGGREDVNGGGDRADVNGGGDRADVNEDGGRADVNGNGDGGLTDVTEDGGYMLQRDSPNPNPEILNSKSGDVLRRSQRATKGVPPERLGYRENF